MLSVCSGECVEWEQKLLEEVKAVCEYAKNDWYRVYLLRTLNRHAGTDCVQAVMNSPPYEWVFPAELLRKQVSVVRSKAFLLLRLFFLLICNPYIEHVSYLKRLIPVEVDRFLCCGEQYRAVRNGVGQVVLESNRDTLKAALQVAVLSLHL